MQRLMYVSQLKNEHCADFQSHISKQEAKLKEWLISQGVVTCTVFAYDRLLFLYLENEQQGYEFIWPKSYTEWLEIWPGKDEPRTSVALLDVYHDCQPDSVESWRGKRKIEQRIGSLARLKPEMYCSYVFYHYQYQEERNKGSNKTYLIGAYENYIFSYCELPAVLEKEMTSGLLHTNNSPPNWYEVMVPHFRLWADTSEKEQLWREMETLFSF